MPRDDQVGHQEGFLCGKGCCALEQASQGNGGFIIPGSVQEKTGLGTQCCGLVDVVVVLSKFGLNGLGGLLQP